MEGPSAGRSSWSAQGQGLLVSATQPSRGSPRSYTTRWDTTGRFARLGWPATLRLGRIQLEKLRRFGQAHSDQTSSWGCFSRPRPPYPLPTGSHPPDGPTARRPALPSFPEFAATPHKAIGLSLSAGTRDAASGLRQSAGSLGRGSLWRTGRQAGPASSPNLEQPRRSRRPPSQIRVTESKPS